MKRSSSRLRAAMLCTSITLAGMASAQAADFSCRAYLGNKPTSSTASNMFSRISAPNQAEAEASFLAGVSRTPIAMRGIHNLRCVAN